MVANFRDPNSKISKHDELLSNSIVGDWMVRSRKKELLRRDPDCCTVRSGGRLVGRSREKRLLRRYHPTQPVPYSSTFSPSPCFPCGLHTAVLKFLLASSLGTRVMYLAVVVQQHSGTIFFTTQHARYSITTVYPAGVVQQHSSGKIFFCYPAAR